jgi:hypothetical protein
MVCDAAALPAFHGMQVWRATIAACLLWVIRDIEVLWPDVRFKLPRGPLLMSALGHKRTFRDVPAMSALPPKADIG